MSGKSIYKNRNKRCDRLATHVFLFSAKNRIYKQNTHTHTQSGAENSLFQFWLTITKAFSPFRITTNYWNLSAWWAYGFVNRAFSLTWPASMLIYWNKRKHLHEKRVQLPEDFLGTPTWPPFHCFGTPIWPPWRHVKTLYSSADNQLIMRVNKPKLE